jgi:hypothetical protein
MSWYKNTSVLSAILAALAILLSQMPPITSWLPRPKLKVIHSDRIKIGNNIGIICFNFSLNLDNEGNVPLDVTKIEFEVLSPSGAKKTYMARSYRKPAAQGSQTVTLAITSINIKENETWNAFVYFKEDIDPTTEQELSNIRLSISQSIHSEQDRKKALGDDSRAKIAPAIVKKSEDCFNKRFSLKKGEYTTKLMVHTNQREVPFEVRSKFIIYDFHLEKMKAQVDDYKYGWGVFSSPDRNKRVWVTLEPDKTN